MKLRVTRLRATIVSFTLGCTTPVLVWAGGTAVLEFGSGNDSVQSHIEFDGDILRMGMGQGEDYMLVRDGRFYSVSHQGGQPIVMDMGQMMGMLGGMMEQQSADVTGDMNTLVSLESTGRDETIAGIQGEVYTATYTDGDGATRTDEVVLGRDARLNELTRAMQSWGETMAQNLNTPVNNEPMEALLERGDGVLRFGSDYRLVSINGDTPSASRFELPAEPQQFPGFGGMPSGQPGGSAQSDTASTQSSGSNPVEQQAERQAQRQQQRVENRAQNEVDRAADNAVDRAVDGVFRSIFGR